MGGVLSSVLGTNSSVDVAGGVNPYQAIQPWQQQQQDLAKQLQGQATGTSGPNPAQLQLIQNSQKIAQQQAMQNAQNRAINPGLAARMSGQAASQLGSQAASNAAIQQQQQQLASQQLLGNVADQGSKALNQASGINAGVAAGNQQQAGQIVGGLMSGAGAALMAHGGMVHPQHFDMGGMSMPVMGAQMASVPAAPSLGANMAPMTPNPEFGPNLGADNFGLNPLKQPELGESIYGNAPASQDDSGSGAKSQAGKFLSGAGKSMNGGNPMGELQSMMALGRFKGGSVDMQSGGNVPGNARVSGDAPQNDTVPAMLSPGEVVVPRSIINSEDAPNRAAKFIAAVMAHKSMKKKAA